MPLKCLPITILTKLQEFGFVISLSFKRVVTAGVNVLVKYINTSSNTRHTDEMIKKLESAGLGYRVRADETTERIGKVNSLFTMVVLVLEHFKLRYLP